jgi:hypothetical protein
MILLERRYSRSGVILRRQRAYKTLRNMWRDAKDKSCSFSRTENLHPTTETSMVKHFFM